MILKMGPFGKGQLRPKKNLSVVNSLTLLDTSMGVSKSPLILLYTNQETLSPQNLSFVGFLKMNQCH